MTIKAQEPMPAFLAGQPWAWNDRMEHGEPQIVISLAGRAAPLILTVNDLRRMTAAVKTLVQIHEAAR